MLLASDCQPFQYLERTASGLIGGKRAWMARRGLEDVYNFVMEKPSLGGFEDALYKLKRAVYTMTECAATRQTTLDSYFFAGSAL